MCPKADTTVTNAIIVRSVGCWFGGEPECLGNPSLEVKVDKVGAPQRKCECAPASMVSPNGFKHCGEDMGVVLAVIVVVNRAKEGGRTK